MDGRLNDFDRLFEDVDRLIEIVVGLLGRLRPALGEDWPRFSSQLEMILASSDTPGRSESALAGEISSLFNGYPIAHTLLVEEINRIGQANHIRQSREAAEPVRGVELVDAAAVRPRYLNIVLVDSAGAPVERRSPLRSDRAYDLHVGIGEWSAASLIEGDARPFPEAAMPPDEQGHWLEVVAASPDLRISPPDPLTLFLPLAGPAWSCRCPSGGRHSCTPADRRPHVEVHLLTPASPRTVNVRLGVYHDGHLLQSALVTADVADDQRAPGGIVARLDYTASPELGDVASLRPRLYSIVTNERADGTHVLYWKGGPGEGVTVAATEGQLATAMTDFRETLFNAHIKTIGNSRENLYDRNNGKSRTAYLADLQALALLGRQLWGALWIMARKTLPSRTEETDVNVVQIARVRNSDYIFPWSVLYDFPLDDPQPRATYEACPIVDSWETAVQQTYPRQCPYRGQHRRNTLCPFGFWGFRYAIEVPPSAGNRTLPQEILVGRPASAAVAHSTQLAPKTTKEHLAELGKVLDGFRVLPYQTAASVGQALGERELALVYFYCHGLRTSARTRGPVLVVGEDSEISPNQIITWYESDWLPGTGHWRETAPLVIINGCHTAEITPQSLLSFVDVFAAVDAAGVVGTEITLDQSVAGEAALRFLTHFVGQGGIGAGEAIRRMRLDLLTKGNVTGLAYTAYCSADLHLRRH